MGGQRESWKVLLHIIVEAKGVTSDRGNCQPCIMSDSREILKHIRTQSTSSFNRLRSISEDAEFVSRVAVAYPQFPLVGEPPALIPALC